MDLYKRLLGRFVAGNNLDTLEAALQNGDAEEASRLTHTLKGVSANLSLVRVRVFSELLEEAIKDNLDHSAIFDGLKQAFDATTEKISEIMS